MNPLADIIQVITAQVEASTFKPSFVAMPRKDYIRYTIKRKPYRMVLRLKKKTS